jgi:hypothetical protein
MKSTNESRQIAFRCTDPIIERVDAISEALTEADGGIPPGRSTVIRRLVLLSLPILETQLGMQAARPRRRKAAS